MHLALIYFISVVGEKEKQSGTVNVRTRDNKVRGEKSIEQVVTIFKTLSKEKILNSEEYGFEEDASDKAAAQ